MPRLLNHLRARPRMTVAALLGLLAGLLASTHWRPVTSGLIGWNVALWLYLGLMAGLMFQADHHHLRRIAERQAQGAAVVLGLVVSAALASLAAIAVELSWVRQAGAHDAAAAAVPHVLLAVSTVLGAWLLLPVVFTLSYATAYHRQQPASGLVFPSDAADFQPQYSDFLYFAMTIAVAAQTSDVVVNRPEMRRLVLLQAVLSFGFNTAILALAINIAAGLF